MNDTEKYLFDLNGYVVLEDAVSAELVVGCNAVLDSFEDMAPVDYPPPLAMGDERTEGNLYISNILEGNEIFTRLMDLPPVLDVIETVTGNPYRLNHTYTIYRWGSGYTGLHMHGTPVNPKCSYRCHSGQMVSTLTKAVFPMLDCGLDDGCFAVVPGTHKANFPMPFGHHPDDHPNLTPVLAKAGDAIVFTEALTHGSLVNTSGQPRRTLYYCYSVGWMPDWGGQNLHYSDDLPPRLNASRRELIALK